MPDSSAEPEQVSTPAMATQLPAGASLLAHRMALLVRGAGFLMGMLVTVGAAVFLFISVSFNDAEIATDLSDYVEMAYERTLSVEHSESSAGVQLVLWPWPALELGPASLSEPNRAQIAASWKSATLDLDLLELMRHRLVIRHARIEGLVLNVARNRQGQWNFADLFEPVEEEPDDVALALQLEGLALAGARLEMTDAASGRSLHLDDVTLRTDALRAGRSGRLRLAARVSAAGSLDGKLTMAANYRFEDSVFSGTATSVQTLYAGSMRELKQAEFSLSAESLQWRDAAWSMNALRARGQGAAGTRRFELTAALPEAHWQKGWHVRNATAQLNLGGSAPTDARGEVRLSLQDLAPAEGGGSTARLEASSQIQGKGRALNAKLAGRLQRDAASDWLELADVTGEAMLTHPALRTPQTQLRLSGSARWSLSAGAGAPIAELNMSAVFAKQALHLAGQLAAGGKEAPWAITGHLESNAFDMDRLLTTGTPPPLPDADALKGWTLDGVIDSENLRAGGMHMASAHVPVKVANGILSFPTHVLQLYGGKFEGSASYDAGKQELNVQEVLRDVQLGELAHDAKLPVPLAGAANVTLEVRSKGTTWRELADSANGGLRLYARDARWLGVDLPRAMLALDAGAAPPSASSATTPLSEVFVAFRLAGSQLEVERLNARSAALALSATGGMDYVKGRMDLKLDARLAANKAFAPIAGKRMALIASGPSLLPKLQLAGEATRPPH